MGTDEKRDSPDVRIVPPVVPVATILAGIGLNYLLPIDLGFAIDTPWRYWIGGLIIVGSVACFGAWPVLLFRRTGQSPIPRTPTTEIVERGPYRITRNPMYLMMVLGCVGVAVLLWNVWILIMIPFCARILNLYAINPEEVYLEENFGDAYRAYKRRVRRWI